MRKFICLIVLLFPAPAFGQSYAGNYRTVFFNLYSEPRMTVAEFEVGANNSLNGKIKIDETVKTFGGAVDKNGKFEAVIEQIGNFTYKLKGKFDKNNKISLVQRNKSGSGLNQSISESAVEGKFSRIAAVQTKPDGETSPQIELIDTGQSRLKIAHSNPAFGKDWTNFTAAITFGNLAKTPAGSESKRVTGTSEDSDYFVVRAKSRIDGQQTLSINVPLSSSDKKIWRQNELRVISYREINGEQRNTFLSGGATLKSDQRFTEGRLEIVRETETQIVFKLTNFKIKRLGKEDFVTLNGFIYADK